MPIVPWSGTFSFEHPQKCQDDSLATRQQDQRQYEDERKIDCKRNPDLKIENVFKGQDTWHSEMSNNKDRQPCGRVVGAEMPVGLAAYGAAVNDFQIVMQQATPTAARASPQRSSEQSMQC